MNLGIERSTIGDILPGEGEAFLFCLDTIAEFVCDNLEQMRRQKYRGKNRCVRSFRWQVHVLMLSFPRYIINPEATAWSCSGRERYM